ncbi:ankyrin, partial [Zopfia rhizophila CBS 207.26]
VLQILLRHGANVNEEGVQCDTTLHTAAIVGNVNIAKIFLNAGANVTAKNKDDCTALQVAAAAGHAGIVCLLLLRGAQCIINHTQGKIRKCSKSRKR